MKSICSCLCRLSNLLTTSLDCLAHPFMLGVRIYVAWLFFFSGYDKISYWAGTIATFTEEYKVPYLSPEAAAYTGTFIELVLPIFLFLGLGARIPAIILFIFNITNVLFYPTLMGSDVQAICMRQPHILWGTLLAFIIFYGPGKLSVDYLLQRKVCPEYKF